MTTRPFRLATVLRVRRAQEKSARVDLLWGNRRLQEASGSRDRSALHYRTMPASPGPVPTSVFLREQAASDMAAATLTEANSRLARARAEASAAHSRWSLSARRVEALERLELRRRDEASADEARAEAATVDDLITARWIAAASVGQTSGGATP